MLLEEDTDARDEGMVRWVLRELTMVSAIVLVSAIVSVSEGDEVRKKYGSGMVGGGDGWWWVGGRCAGVESVVYVSEPI